jgi:hypothetical protein
MKIQSSVFVWFVLFLALCGCKDNNENKSAYLILCSGSPSPCKPALTLDEPIALRFAVLSDGHYGTGFGTGPANFEAMLNWIKAEKDKNDLDLVFFNGDTINGFDGLYHLMYQTTYQTVKDIYFSRLALPYYVIKGNHDFIDGEAFWQSTWGYPANHSFALGDSAFILANSSILQTPRTDLFTVWQYGCAFMDNNWLGSEIAGYSDKKNVFILMHVAPLKIPEYETPSCTYNCLTCDCSDFRTTIEQYSNVKALFHGHLHEYPLEKVINGKHYFWDGAFGDGETRVFGKGYRIVEVGTGGKIHTYRCNKACNTIDQESIIE